jgi:photosystem II stability/assembly factor-like uncharacterized protein
MTATAAEAPVPAADARLAARSLLTAVTSAPNGTLVAAGERGHVLVSQDGGEHWKQAAVPVDVLLTGACFVNDRTGYLVGHDETILATQDGGQTWRIEHFAPESAQPFLHVVCSADGSVVAVGAYATLARRPAGEGAFRLQELTAAAPTAARRPARMDDDAELEQPHLNAVARAESGVLYVAGEAGHLYRSDDGGDHWVTLPSPYTGSFFTVLALGDSSLLVAGLRGHVYRSSDKGQHWTEIQSTTDVLLDGAAVLADGRIVLVGMAGVVLVSDDGGLSFARLRLADRKGLAAVAVGPKGPVIVGENGVQRLMLETGK